jgi:hypothetical protein
MTKSLSAIYICFVHRNFAIGNYPF